MKGAIISLLLVATLAHGAVLPKEDYVESGRDDPSQAAAICATKGSDNSFVAHENCAKFYQCWAGQPIPFDCGSGTFWNPNKNYCDFLYNVNCGDRIIPEKPEDDNVLVPVDPVIPEGNNHDDPSQALKICAAAEKRNVLVAHENCNQFYMCSHGVPIAQSCQAGLLFDPRRDRCEWPSYVDCGSRIL